VYVVSVWWVHKVREPELHSCTASVNVHQLVVCLSTGVGIVSSVM